MEKWTGVLTKAVFPQRPASKWIAKNNLVIYNKFLKLKNLQDVSYKSRISSNLVIAGLSHGPVVPVGKTAVSIAIWP